LGWPRLYPHQSYRYLWFMSATLQWLWFQLLLGLWQLLLPKLKHL